MVVLEEIRGGLAWKLQRSKIKEFMNGASLVRVLFAGQTVLEIKRDANS